MLVSVPGVQKTLDRVLEVRDAPEDTAADRLAVDDREPGFSQANAKLVYRTALTVDDPKGARHVVPLKLRKGIKPLLRKASDV